MGKVMKRAAIYLRVSTQDQNTSNQEHELRQAAERAGWQVVRVYKDHGISGAKGRNGRPAFDALCRDATKRQFALAYSGPSAKVNDLAGRRSRTSWLSESEQLWRAA